jgi:hypothetical protein
VADAHRTPAGDALLLDRDRAGVEADVAPAQSGRVTSA